MRGQRHMDRIIIRHLQGKELSDVEQSRLDHWLNSAEKNRSYFSEHEKLWEQKRFMEDLESIDVERIRAGLDEKIRRLSEEKPESMAMKTMRIMTWRAAAIAVILLATSATLLLWQGDKRKRTILADAQDTHQQIIFPDGSNIDLRKGSSLKYPENWKGLKREVVLEGEAFFEIREMRWRPFVVQAGNHTIRVLGTSFHIKEQEGRLILGVVSGSVKIFETADRDQGLVIHARQQAVFKSSMGTYQTDTLESENFLFWKTRQLEYMDAPLTLVFDELQEYYGANIRIADRAVLKDRVSTTFLQQSLEEILQELYLLHDLSYERRGDTIVVRKK